MAVTLAERSQPARPPLSASPATLSRPRRPVTAPRNRDPRSITLQKFVIEGGVPLSGTIVPAGNKNGALPILAACLLTDDEVILRNAPRIRDVEAMMALLRDLGASAQWEGPGEVLIDASNVGHCHVN